MKCAMVIGLALALCVPLARAQESVQAHEMRSGDPELLSFDDLITLSATAHPEGELNARLASLLTTPFIHNQASAAGAQPHRPSVQNLGPVLRVGLWNIERGLNFELIQAVLTDAGAFKRFEDNERQIPDGRRSLIESQLNNLQDVDVLILNEVDFGMKRTGYKDVARELAAALHMNYAYGVEFVELDSIFDLGTQEVHLPDARQDARLQQDLQVDRQRYHGLHGTAILSRYPIRNARIVRLPMCYEWYNQEAKDATKLEQGKRWAARTLFKERVEREVRHGGRMALIADLAIPDLPTREATIVAAHLENKCPSRAVVCK